MKNDDPDHLSSKFNKSNGRLIPCRAIRLEAGLCLYGHDLSDEVSPVEGALTWTIGESPFMLALV